MIPQVNPLASFHAQEHEIRDAISDVLDDGTYILGEQVAAFEHEFAQYLGVDHAVGCASGTDAIALALRALGIGRGDKVVTVSHTAVATVAAIEMVGATPVLIDIEPLYYTMDPNELASVLKADHNHRIKAAIPVHLYGQPADIIDIATICSLHDVWCIEDCSQAHGAMVGKHKVGTFGNLATFSFYPTKNLGAIGDGGMVVTNDIELDSELCALRQYGWANEARISECPGINSRLDEIQAAILRVKLKRLDDNNNLRRQLAISYDEVVPPWMRPAERPGVTGVYHHQYVIRHTKRDLIRARLADAGVATAIHYPVPVHLQPAYKDRVALGPSKCHETKLATQQILSLPMWPEMSHEQIQTVCNALSLAVRDV